MNLVDTWRRRFRLRTVCSRLQPRRDIRIKQNNQPNTLASNKLCRSVNRKSFASSSRFIPVAQVATAMLDKLIIFPITPPAEFDAAINTGFNPNFDAVTTCRFPNSALAEVSEPVRNTPIHPSSALKNGNDAPVAANASPRVAVAPQ